jgi:capsular polysaccharide biosynthesis protein
MNPKTAYRLARLKLNSIVSPFSNLAKRIIPTEIKDRSVLLLKSYIERANLKHASAIIVYTNNILISKLKVLDGGEAISCCRYINLPKSIKLSIDAEAFKYPEIFLYEDDVRVFGGSNLVLNGDKLISDPLIDFRNTILAEEFKRLVQFDSEYKKVKISYYERKIKLDRAVVFLNGASFNYAHWITEVLPKIVIWSRDHLVSDATLIIDKQLPDTILESIDFVFKNAKIIKLERNHSLNIKKCFWYSEVCYIPFHPRINSSVMKSATINQKALLLLKEVVLKKTKYKNDRNYPKKIFIKRKSLLRSINNEKHIISILKKYGYECIDPEDFSFAEQVEIFSQAESVIAASGAAIANMIFAQRGASIFIFMVDHPSTPFHYWTRLLSPLGINVSYLFNAPTDCTDFHSSFSVSSSLLIDYLRNNSTEN